MIRALEEQMVGGESSSSAFNQKRRHETDSSAEEESFNGCNDEVADAYKQLMQKRRKLQQV